MKPLESESVMQLTDENPWEVRETERGFHLVKFKDCYGKPCSLQASSLAIYQQPGTSAIWLGVDSERMHLTHEQVKILINYLQTWVDSDKGQFT